MPTAEMTSSVERFSPGYSPDVEPLTATITPEDTRGYKQPDVAALRRQVEAIAVPSQPAPREAQTPENVSDRFTRAVSIGHNLGAVRNIALLS